MSQNFVLYSPDVKHIEPDFEQTLKPLLSALRWITNLGETSSIEQKGH